MSAARIESQHLIWSPLGKPLSIHVNPRVLARLRPGRAPPGEPRLPERGGLLLGYAREIEDKWLIAVEDSKEIRVSQRRGESWGIQDSDRRELESALRGWSRERRSDHPYVVGWYRTHTRAGLYLDESDFRFFLEYFPPPANVALALSPDKGGFFFWEEGEIQRSRPYETFALPELPASEAVTAKPAPNRVGVSAPRRAWLAAPVVAGAAIGLLWNPDPLRRPAAATGQGSEIPGVELSEPRAVFAPPPLPVESFNETKPFTPPPETPPAPSYRARATEPPAAKPRPVRQLQIPSTRITAAEPVLDVEAPVIAATARDYRPVLTQKKDPPVQTTMEPSKPSAIRRVVGSIPGLGFIKRRKQATDNDGYTPPRAVKEVRPKSPGGLAEEVPVRVRVLLNSDGEIERTELLTRKVLPAVAKAAVDAAQHWRFEPARMDEKPVASEVIVQFVFPAATPGGGI